jgi:hypothetical protein
MSFNNYLYSRLHYLNIRKGGLYYHYKSIHHDRYIYHTKKIYKVLHLAIQEGEIENIMVVYEEQFGDKIIWVINLNEWNEEVIDKYGNKRPIFSPANE